MELLYIANIRLPTEKAHGIQIMKTCEALADAGVNVELVVPRRKNHIRENPFEYYGVDQSFKVTYLWCLDLVKWGRFGYWIEMLTFAERTVWHVLFKKGTFYTRDEFLAFYLKLIGKKVTWEVHMGQKNFFALLLVWLKVPMVVISDGLKDLYISLGVNPKNIQVIPDGVDLNLFNKKITRREARDRLGLSESAKIVVYTGSLYPWKGVDILAEAAKILPAETLVVFVGGTEPDVKQFKNKFGGVKNVAIIGHRDHSEIPLWQKAADVLVLPNTAKENISKYYTSPMKLFEYMASRRPIVASNIPSIAEILNDSNAVLVLPDDPQDLARGVEEILKNKNDSVALADKAYQDVLQHTWEQRAGRILQFISK